MAISNAKQTKVLFILGATGTGKSKLAISLAKGFKGEIINSDKIQVYDAIPVITNRVSESELSAALHHLLAFLPPDAEFNASDFINYCIDTISAIASRNHFPIIAGGSNSYIKALLEDPRFCGSHESCFIWLDANRDILNRFVSVRVDSMMEQGLVAEAQSLFDPENSSDYSNGVKRAIGVPELDQYFRAISAGSDKDELEIILQKAVNDIKENTCKLVHEQVQKIWRLREDRKLRIHQINVSEYHTAKLAGKLDDVEENDLWENVVGLPCHHVVKEFLDVKVENDQQKSIAEMNTCSANVIA